MKIKNLRVVFIHPDLGIGGAERLVLDVAVALKQQGVQVSFVTNHFDETHAFEELKSGDYPVRVVGDWMPRSICGKFQALCAYIRMIYLSLVYVLFLRHFDKPDVYFVDQIPMAVPFIKCMSGKVIYYCHHPDLLASTRESALKRLYRKPIDWLEKYGTGKSDIILVNSEYTASVFSETFPSIKTKIQILYPTIAASYKDMIEKLSPKNMEDLVPEIKSNEKNTVFLSVNRFHPAKKLELAIEAMEHFKNNTSTSIWQTTYLIMAGGYDPQSDINKRYFDQLVNLTNSKSLSSNIIFIKSPSDDFKANLLLACSCLVYTPVKEHFGIVPLEAMTARKPVIACNSGGPCETVKSNVTGYLCEPTPESISEAMLKMCESNLRSTMGEQGWNRMEKKFSYKTFYNQTMDIILQAVGCEVVTDKCSK